MTREAKEPADQDGRKGFFGRLRAKLNRGDSWLTYDLANLFKGRAIDAEAMDELETRLLTADVGVEATQHILSALNKRVARKELAEILERPVHLFLFVKVREDWGDDPERYREMGLEFPKR